MSCQSEDGEHSEENSEVYDPALVLLSIYHMIEWVRVIVFAVVVIIGANLMLIYQILSLNAIYGLIAYIVAHAAYFSTRGQECKDFQETRANFLLADIIVFWVTFVLQQIPYLFLFPIGKASCQECLKEEDEDENKD